MNFSTGSTNSFLKLVDFLGSKQCKERFKSPGPCSEMEVNLAPNKINLLPIMQLVKVTEIKIKFLPTQWLKLQQIGNIYFFA